jgi:hypothetical protein
MRHGFGHRSQVVPQPFNGWWQGDSGHVAIIVSVAFGRLEPVAELEQLIKHKNFGAER